MIQTVKRPSSNPKPRAIALVSLLLGMLLPLRPVAASNPDLEETAEVEWTSEAAAELALKAADLGSPARIYEYVRNDFEYVVYHGSRSGSVNTFFARRGNDVDIASALIAMFRSQGFPARYASGQILLPAADAMSWLRVKDPELAAQILVAQGVQDVVLIGEDGDAIQLEHVWVEVLVPFTNYRGAGPGFLQIDCDATPERCSWIPLDPSFKLREYHGQDFAILDALDFDYDAYYAAIENADPERMGKNPLEIYEEQILGHLRASFPGKTLEDVADPGEIIGEERSILPASLPYEIFPETLARFNSIADHDAQTTGPPWQKFLTLNLFWQTETSKGRPDFDPDDPSLRVSPQLKALMAGLSTKSLLLTFRECGQDCTEAVLILDGQEAAVAPLNPAAVATFDHFVIDLEIDGSPSTASGPNEFEIISATYFNNVLDGHYAIAAGGESSNWSQVQHSASRLLEALDEFPLLFDEATAVPHVDRNRDGTIDPNDPPLAEDPEANDALTGGLLDAAVRLYFVRLRESTDRLAALNHVRTTISGWVGLARTQAEIDYIDGTPFSINLAGMIIDMKALRFASSLRDDRRFEFSQEHFELLVHIASSLEHEVWQELTGLQAISTVRGIQQALAQGAELLNPKKTATEDTLPSFYPAFGFEPNVPSPFLLRDDIELRIFVPQNTQRPYDFLGFFDTEPTSWYVPEGESFPGTFFDAFKASFDLSTPAHLLRGFFWPPYTDWDADLTLLNSAEDTVTPVMNQGQFGTATGIVLPCFEGGLLNFADTNAVNIYLCWDQLYNRFWAPVYELIDRSQGFVPSEFVYRRADSLPPEAHPTRTIRDIRDTLYLNILSGEETEYLIPSQATLTQAGVFEVFIRKVTKTGSFRMQFAIRNRDFEAGGGYVTESEPINQCLAPLNLVDSLPFEPANFCAIRHPVTSNDPIRSASTKDPVSTVTGNMYHDETDVIIKGRGLELVFTRTYNSLPGRSGGDGLPLGHGWTHSYNMQLMSNDFGAIPSADATLIPENENGRTSSITYVNERAGEVNFLVDDSSASPTWAITPPQGVFDSLELDTPTAGLHTLTFRNGVSYVFEGPDDLRDPNRAARLARIEDPFGNVLTLTYDGSGRLENVRDGLGAPERSGLSFGYDPNSGLLESMSDWTGRIWRYAYAQSGERLLSSVTNPLDQMTQYRYQPQSHLLTEIILPEDRDGDGQQGDVRTLFAYYANARAFSNANSLGQGEALSYDLHSKRTRVTDPRGFNREFSYDSSGLLTKLAEPDGGRLFFAYNVDGLRDAKTDALGFTTRYSYCQARSLDGCASDTGGNPSSEVDPLGQSAEFDYDIFDQPARVRDKNGNDRLFTYYTDSDPNTGTVRGKLHQDLVTLRDPNGALREIVLHEYTYHPDGNLKQKLEFIDPNDPSRIRVTDFFYDPFGINLEEIHVSGSGKIIRQGFSYDALGRHETETLWRRASLDDPNLVPLTTTFEYDALDRVTRVTDPLGNIRETLYDENGQVAKIRGHFRRPDGSFDLRDLSTRVYDLADRLIEETDAYGQVTDFEYDEAGNLIKRTDANGHSIRFEYDAMGRRAAVINENGQATRMLYDLAGQLVMRIDANGNTTEFAYDAQGRRIRITDPLGFETRFEYDGNGNLTKTVDTNATQFEPETPEWDARTNAQDATESREYDELDRLVRILDATDGETRFTYDLLGNRTSITDAEGRRTDFIYNDLVELIEVRGPLIEGPQDHVVVFSHDEAGNILTRTDRKGQVGRFTYDSLNRLRQAEYADGSSESFDYDIYGNLDSIANQDIAYSFTYDPPSRLQSKTDLRLDRTLALAYDAAGNVIRKTDFQSDETEFRYDSTNRLVAERNPAYVEVSYQYDPAGRLLSRILSSGARTSYAYDASGRLTSLSNITADGTVLDSRSYEYDRLGNIVRVLNEVGTELVSYDYDPLYRLTSADYPGTDTDELYSYDRVGNRGTRTIGSSPVAYGYDAGNRLRTIRAGLDPNSGTLLFSFDYDENGNLLRRRDGVGTTLQSFVYDPKNRVKEIVTGTVSNTFRYDPLDFRVEKVDSTGVHRLLLDSENLEAVYDDGNALRAKYLRGAVIDEVVSGWFYDDSGTRTNYTYHHDQLQSVIGLSGHAGSTLEETTYTAFGEIQSTTGATANTLHYTGRELDPDTGLYYYRARYYDPTLGRFLSEDPLGFQAGINFYTYVANNPINSNDPTGLTTIAIGGGATAGAGAGVAGSGLIAFDDEGNTALVEGVAAGGFGGLSISGGLQLVVFPGADTTVFDLEGTFGLVGISTPIGGLDLIFAEGSSVPAGLALTFGPSVGLTPVSLHGMAGTTAVQPITLPDPFGALREDLQACCPLSFFSPSVSRFATGSPSLVDAFREEARRTLSRSSRSPSSTAPPLPLEPYVSTPRIPTTLRIYGK